MQERRGRCWPGPPPTTHHVLSPLPEVAHYGPHELDDDDMYWLRICAPAMLITITSSLQLLTSLTPQSSLIHLLASLGIILETTLES